MTENFTTSATMDHPQSKLVVFRTPTGRYPLSPRGAGEGHTTTIHIDIGSETRRALSKKDESLNQKKLLCL